MRDDRQRERLRWRCRRGMLELDLILLNAFECHYDRLSEAERHAFERLLALEDTTLLVYLQGGEDSPDPELKQLVQKLRQ